MSYIYILNLPFSLAFWRELTGFRPCRNISGLKFNMRWCNTVSFLTGFLSPKPSSERTDILFIPPPCLPPQRKSPPTFICPVPTYSLTVSLAFTFTQPIYLLPFPSQYSSLYPPLCKKTKLPSSLLLHCLLHPPHSLTTLKFHPAPCVPLPVSQSFPAPTISPCSAFRLLACTLNPWYTPLNLPLLHFKLSALSFLYILIPPSHRS